MPGSGMGPQKLRVDLSLSIGENKDYYKVSISGFTGKVLKLFLAHGKGR